MKPVLTQEALCREAALFSQVQSQQQEANLYGVTDGKAIGTYLEQRFRAFLRSQYEFQEGSSALGIDFPGLNVDMKVTSIRQPQSSCPFRSARQKIYGLGYHLLVFVYEKTDDPETRTGRLHITCTIFVDQARTADYQTTTQIRQILDNDGNEDDLLAFLHDINLPVDDIAANELVRDIMEHPPEIGYLTISNALQWRLQYTRLIVKAGQVSGLQRIL